MFCYNCGSEIADDVNFCPNCGAKKKMPEGIKVIQLRCSSCQGIMEIDADKKEVYCPYCGTKELILDSDAVAVEKIKKEVELAKLENEKEQHKLEEQEQQRLSYKKGKLSKLTLLLTAICLGFGVSAFAVGNVLGGIFSLLQVLAFSFSWLTGMNIIKEKRKSIHTALFILGILLIIPRSTFKNETHQILRELTWPDSGLALYLPNPNATYGVIDSDTDNRFSVRLQKISDEAYGKYIKQCKEKGFVVDPESNSISYNAFNEEGYKLELIHWHSKELEITLEPPIEMYDFSWPDSDMANLIPAPTSTFGKVDWESDYGFCIYVGNTTKQEFRDYVKLCRGQGFAVKLSQDNRYFSAENKDGYNLNITYEGYNVMRIRMNEPN